MLKLLEYEAVIHHKWIQPEEFVQMVGSTFLFPGLTAVKLSALIGYKAAGSLGLILAVICLNLPGLIMSFVGYQALASQSGLLAQKITSAVQYGALALLAAATFTIAAGIMNSYFSSTLLLMSIIFFIALAYGGISPFWGFLSFVLLGTLIQIIL